MKKLILLELVLLFLAATFPSHNPPGWYTQTLPVNDEITDIFFLDSLNGWITTQGGTSGDTAYIMHTTNGGDNWNIQFFSPINITSKVKFLDENTGYVGSSAGSFAAMLKTTNGGTNWGLIPGTISSAFLVEDMSWINVDTGWVCEHSGFAGGIFKTTNGGLSWVRQMSADSLISHIFFINRDTGWASSNNNKLYRTITGGQNWTLQYWDPNLFRDIFFLNGKKGWARTGTTGTGAKYTTDGGFTWNNSTGNTNAGENIKFINDSIGYSGSALYKISRSLDGGKTWGYQLTSQYNNMKIQFLPNDTSHGWAGLTTLIHTNNGGGPITYTGITSFGENKPDVYTLYQNYPNPFNPATTIKYNLSVSGFVTIKVFDLNGREIETLISKRQEQGSHEVTFDGGNLSSGVYFYTLTYDRTADRFIDSRKMLLIK